MQQTYTLQDIHDLLAQKYHRCQWNYEIFDNRTGKTKVATLEDFTDCVHGTIPLVMISRGDKYCLDISVTDYSFHVYEDESNIMGSGSTTSLRDNFTNDWTTLLLNNHGEKYAKKLINYCQKCTKKINDNAMQEISEYVKKINARAELAVLPYYKLIEKAQGFLPSTADAEDAKEI